MFGAYKFGSASYQKLYGTEKGISTSYFILHIVCFLLFYLGYLLSKKIKIFSGKKNDYSVSEIDLQSVLKVYKITYYITIFAYIIWYSRFIMLNGIYILLNFKSITSISAMTTIMRNNSGKIAGITSFTEMGIVSITLGSFLILKIDKVNKKKIIKQLIILLLLTSFRALAFSERISLLELLLPIVIVYLSNTKNTKIKTITLIAPIIAIMFLLVCFAIFEYPRSWLKHYQYVYDGSYLSFVIQRITGYYFCAINTECLALKYIPEIKIPFYSINWFWNIPGMYDLYINLTSNDILTKYDNLLQIHGNPEFNNEGGLFTFVKDFGILFPFFQIIFGFLVGKAYNGLLKNNFYGIVIYSWIFVIMMELPRYYMPGNTRFCAVYVGLTIMLFGIKNKASLSKIKVM